MKLLFVANYVLETNSLNEEDFPPFQLQNKIDLHFVNNSEPGRKLPPRTHASAPSVFMTVILYDSSCYIQRRRRRDRHRARDDYQRRVGHEGQESSSASMAKEKMASENFPYPRISLIPYWIWPQVIPLKIQPTVALNHRTQITPRGIQGLVKGTHLARTP